MIPDEPEALLIAVCTFRRAAIAETLESLARLQPCGLPVRIAVADNDTAPSARAAIEAIAAAHPLPITYLHAPQANISVARNALLDHARSTGIRLMAWIDDDEIADPAWLAALVRMWRACGPDGRPGAVLGPVRADYLPGAPAWMDRARAHDTLPVIGQDGAIASGYTCNMLLDLNDPAAAGLRFDLGRGRTGGEDSAFFAAFRAAGGRIAFAPDALVRETVPPDRARLGWLMRRRYRMGQTHASLIAQDRGALGRAAAAGLAGAKAAACAGLALLAAADPARRNRQIMRAALHMGAVAHLAGARQIVIYGTPAGTKSPDGAAPEEN